MRECADTLLHNQRIPGVVWILRAGIHAVGYGCIDYGAASERRASSDHGSSGPCRTANPMPPAVHRDRQSWPMLHRQLRRPVCEQQLNGPRGLHVSSDNSGDPGMLRWPLALGSSCSQHSTIQRLVSAELRPTLYIHPYLCALGSSVSKSYLALAGPIPSFSDLLRG